MPERNGAASRIHLAAIEPQLLEYRDRLDGEGQRQGERDEAERQATTAPMARASSVLRTALVSESMLNGFSR